MRVLKSRLYISTTQLRPDRSFVNDGLRRPKVKAMPYPHWDSAENGFPIFLSSPLSSSQKQTSTEKFLAVLPDLDSKKSPK